MYPPVVFERLFDHVFAQCVRQGLVAGDTQAVDSAPVKANASLESVRPKQVAGTLTPYVMDTAPGSSPGPALGSLTSAPAHQLRYLAPLQAKRATQEGAPGAQHPKARLLKSQCRPIVCTAYDPAYKRAWMRQHSAQSGRMKRLHHSTVEPVFGSLIHHYGLRRINMRGKAGAHKAMLLAAITYNLKKLLKHRPQQQLGLAIALPKPPPPPSALLFQLRTRSRKPKCPPAKLEDNRS